MVANPDAIDWDTLLDRLQRGECTPFLGAGACAGFLPLGFEIARDWVQQHKYPFDPSDELPLVAQFFAVERKNPHWPKEEMRRHLQEMLRAGRKPDFNDPYDLHGLFADLPIPVYLTTNYDDFLVQALIARGKNPQADVCIWNGLMRGARHRRRNRPFVEFDERNPLVFHLHGSLSELHSLVVSEDDYVDFLVSLSRDRDRLLPPRVQEALTLSSLLFVGYRLADWSFRVVFQGLRGTIESNQQIQSLTVQLRPDETREDLAQHKREYWVKYFGRSNIGVYWGRAEDFARELRERWDARPR